MSMTQEYLVFWGSMGDILKLKDSHLNNLWEKNNAWMEELTKSKKEFMSYLNEIGMSKSKDARGLNCSIPSTPSLFMALKNGLDISKEYSLNSLKFRSDEFTDSHNELHVLFSGCSVSYGDSLPLKYAWTKIVHDRIQPTSGFFNLSSPGNTIDKVIDDVLKYIDCFGIPDVALLLFPDFERGVGREKPQLVNKINYDKYDLLEKLFDSAGKILISSSWSIRKKDYPLNTFKTFVPFSPDDLNRFVYDSLDSYVGSDQDWLLRAADLAHPGILEHRFYADLMYNSYYEKANQRN